MDAIKGIVNKVASRKLAVTAVAGAAAATGAIEPTWPMVASRTDGSPYPSMIPSYASGYRNCLRIDNPQLRWQLSQLLMRNGAAVHRVRDEEELLGHQQIWLQLVEQGGVGFEISRGGTRAIRRAGPVAPSRRWCADPSACRIYH